MTVTLPIPDDLTARLGGADDVSRRALEVFAVEEYRAGRLTRPELRRLLGFATPAEFDGFLEARGLFAEHAPADQEQERQDLERRDGLVARIRSFRVGKTLGGLDPIALIREGRR